MDPPSSWGLRNADQVRAEMNGNATCLSQVPDRDSIHVYVECDENDGYEDDLECEEESTVQLASLAPTDEW